MKCFLVICSYMNYMTPSELATYLRLSKIMVYKLAQQGEMPAMKIGRVWRFSREEIDRWMAEKEGEKGGMTAMIVREFGDRLRAILGDRLCRVVLFGSYARGEETPESDIDLLVVLSDGVTADDRRMVSRIAYEETYGKDRSRHLSTVVLSEDEFLTQTTPLLINVRREGKVAA